MDKKLRGAAMKTQNGVLMVVLEKGISEQDSVVLSEKISRMEGVKIVYRFLPGIDYPCSGDKSGKKSCGKCGSTIKEPGPCPVCKDKPYGGIRYPGEGAKKIAQVSGEFIRSRIEHPSMDPELSAIQKGVRAACLDLSDIKPDLKKSDE